MIKDMAKSFAELAAATHSARNAFKEFADAIILTMVTHGAPPGFHRASVRDPDAFAPETLQLFYNNASHGRFDGVDPRELPNGVLIVAGLLRRQKRRGFRIQGWCFDVARFNAFQAFAWLVRNNIGFERFVPGVGPDKFGNVPRYHAQRIPEESV